MEKGYVQVYTGDGKGKTTAALGLAMRAAGAGLRVYIGQFMKKGEYSELGALSRFSDLITVEQFGTGRFIVGAPSAEEKEAARKGLDAIMTAIASRDFDLVILEEANVAVKFGLIADADILRAIETRPPGVELVITGRGASAAVIERADLVTEMRAIKHYFEKGVAARRGIES